MGKPVTIGPFGKRWTQVSGTIPYTGTEPLSEVGKEAAQVMKSLIDATWSVVQKIKGKQ